MNFARLAIVSNSSSACSEAWLENVYEPELVVELSVAHALGDLPDQADEYDNWLEEQSVDPDHEWSYTGPALTQVSQDPSDYDPIPF